jgi:hypothetical protein
MNEQAFRLRPERCKTPFRPPQGWLPELFKCAVTDVISQGESRRCPQGHCCSPGSRGLRGLRGVDAVQADALAVDFKACRRRYMGLLFLSAVPISEEEAERGLGKYAAKIG